MNICITYEAKYALMTNCMDLKTKSIKIMDELPQPKQMTKLGWSQN